MSRRYKKAVDRQQGLLLPERVDDYVSADNPVRVIDVFVDALDLEALEFTNTKGQSAGGGQPSYDPASLLKLYLYGYVNRVHSSRRLEREAHRNLEVIWLTGQQRPSYKTIADFRKNNGPSLKAVHKGFLLTCKELGLLGGEVVGIDGSFFQGDASKKSIHTEKHLNKQLRELDRKIEAYQQQLAQQDRRDEQSGQGSLVQTPGLEEKLEQLRQKQAEKKSLVEQLKASGQPQISLTDPDARLLSKRGHSLAGYHVQLAVDAKHKLIAVSQLTQEGNDAHQLSGMAIEAKEFLGVEQLTVVADSGYYEGEQIKTCEDQQITPYVGVPKTRDLGRYPREAFVYEPEPNRYRCPQGQGLWPVGKPQKKEHKWQQLYASQPSQCRVCPKQEACLAPKAPKRTLYRWVHEQVMERHKRRMKDAGAWMKLRSALVEHPFATLKRRAGWDHFLVRGLEKVGGELGLMTLAYNFTRALNILGVETLKQYFEQRKRKTGEYRYT